MAIPEISRITGYSISSGFQGATAVVANDWMHLPFTGLSFSPDTRHTLTSTYKHKTSHKEHFQDRECSDPLLNAPNRIQNRTASRQVYFFRFWNCNRGTKFHIVSGFATEALFAAAVPRRQIPIIPRGRPQRTAIAAAAATFPQTNTHYRLLMATALHYTTVIDRSNERFHCE